MEIYEVHGRVSVTVSWRILKDYKLTVDIADDQLFLDKIYVRHDVNADVEKTTRLMLPFSGNVHIPDEYAGDEERVREIVEYTFTDGDMWIFEVREVGGQNREDAEFFIDDVDVSIDRIERVG